VNCMLQRKWLSVLAAGAILTAGAAGAYNGLTVNTSTTSETEEPPVLVAPGYHIRKVADQFTAPVGAAVGPKGEVYVAEAGGGTGTPPRVMKVLPGKVRSTVAADFPAPLTGITWREGKLYVAYVGGVDVLDPATGLHHPVLTKLPAGGDHPNSPVAFGPDGRMYLGVGTATNSGVVGLDNIARGWVKQAPDVRDVPCKTVKLRGTNFDVDNPLTPDPFDRAATGAFAPFGKTTARLQTIPGALPCTGSVLRANPDGTGMELVAWGLRHPTSLAFGPEGQLYTAMRGFEERGTRPVVGDQDYFYRVVPDQWYGWPDFAGGRSVTSEEFQQPSAPATPLLAEVPGQPPAPVATVANGSGIAGIAFPLEPFGLRGDALAALAGSRMVVRINPRTGAVTPFAQNKPALPASGVRLSGLEQPAAVAPGPGRTVYLVDFGQTRPGSAGVEAIPGTGVLWKLEYRP
jgi:glucose/arabinose dehydrogenase